MRKRRLQVDTSIYNVSIYVLSVNTFFGVMMMTMTRMRMRRRRIMVMGVQDGA